MSFFEDYFDITDEKIETPVCCPFPHYTSSGLEYQEENPSAHINLDKKVFHCKVCGETGSETMMIQKLFGCNAHKAHRLLDCFNSKEDLYKWNNEATLTEASRTKAIELGISEEVIKELNLKTPNFENDTIAFPVFMFNRLLDIRIYRPGQTPKVRSRSGSLSGLIIPFDEWKDVNNRVTLLCAGEKDMAIARTMGFNAITITGGEQCLPCTPKFFEGKTVAIVYDNDEAGITGAYKVANEILKYTPNVKVVTNFHECLKNKEDITDFFVKYGKTKEDLINYIEATPFFEGKTAVKNNYPIMDLLQASKPENINRVVKSNVQVIAMSDATFVCPSHIIGEKFKEPSDNDVMPKGMCKEWELNEDNAEDILQMIDTGFKPDSIRKNYLKILKIYEKEKNVAISILDQVTVFKCYLTDLFETTNTQKTQPMEYTAYSIQNSSQKEAKLESGQKYMITYKLVPNPFKGQQLVMIILDSEQANDSVTNFELTEEVKNSLRVIQDIPGELPQQIDTLTEKIKGLLGYNGINTLIQAIDFAYHTPLQFNFHTNHNIRAYLDTIIVGESRTGKSSTADCLRSLYGLGTFTSLAGNSATVAGLVGGSNKTANGYQTRAGIVPQNHRGLIIFEEFGKSNTSVITELTDIRSSNEIRITRVAGTITLPAMVRMISLTNPKSKDGNIRSIASYPNGVAVLTDLIAAAEDINRYDLIVILPDRGNAQIDPYWIPEEPLDQQIYRDRIRWIWSRKPEQIIIDRETELYIIETANNLNKTYDGHIKIFGTEAWKKLSRLAIAIAGYVCSSDSTFENIIVKQEHVDYAALYLISLYDNPTFKLKEFINYEKQYTEIDEEGISALQDIYDKNPMLVIQLEQCTQTSKNILMAATGMEQKDLNMALNRMTKMLFVKFHNHDIIPTERFRKGLTSIKRNTYAPKIGEINAEISMDLIDNNNP